MKFEMEGLHEGIGTLSRKIGYRYLGEGKDKRQWSFVRVLGTGGYPRFHLFVERKDKGGWIFNIHLDQKKPVYEGAPAHAGEYKGEVLEREAERIKKKLQD
ncbi:MAG: hypothetical protein GF370_03030 [Candidatus Nealsonbacteria bacterium]|nr:hypothetical protein [Candidatus Nealsonbacteria bacterium]